ncbi:hypothetical protein QTP81_12155 [Alteromonas sp. ASW11-36]|uniref:Uncharacterized protein n=1 Tax=Alteromonas arenosi TaxID=3055817 RepID=A0ABT7SYU3_9ALTE|nr:hypothetical protein [Alteromonas sp. ASW11-36]MDM7861350.1 hypothetical protein [Alteromonas sp. ASW11-36]
MKSLLLLPLFFSSLVLSAPVRADYMQGCEDPEYHQYIAQRFEYFESRNRRLLNDTLRDYEASLSKESSLYQVITNLSRHIKYSAQFEPIETVQLKISHAFKLAREMSTEQKIAGEVVDGFGSQNHYVDIARAWLAYRQGDLDLAFEELLIAIDDVDSALLGAFGPDFDLVRQLYSDGHIEPVVTYIKKTELFWTGKRPNELRDAWLEMIDAGCKIQFDSVDVIKAEQLGVRSINVQEALGLDR